MHELEKLFLHVSLPLRKNLGLETKYVDEELPPEEF